MWVLEWEDKDGNQNKSHYALPHEVFYDFDRLVEKGFKVKYPYYI